jgi:hypothetical protein
MVIKTFLNLKNFETNETNKQMNRNSSGERQKDRFCNLFADNFLNY